MAQNSSPLEISFPLINQIVVNKEFIGIGHTLQDKRRQRRKLDESASILHSRVKQLERQQQRQRKEIRNQEQRLQEILEIKKRQQDDQMNKKWQQRLKTIALNNMKQQSSNMRHEHQKNLSSAMGEFRQRNKDDYTTGKQLLKSREGEKQQFENMMLAKNRELYSRMHQQKRDGKVRIIEFKKDRNREHIEEYQDRILSEQEKKLNRIKQMQELEQRESLLLQKLQQSTERQRLLSERINSARNMPLEQLETLVRPSKSRRMSSGSSSRNSLFSEKSTDIVLPVLVQRQSNPQETQNYRSRLGQASHTVDVVDKPRIKEREISKKVEVDLLSIPKEERDLTERKPKGSKRKSKKKKHSLQQSIDLYLA